MFYKKEDVNETITCQLCSQVYTDPRLLPCGEAACNECIKRDESNEKNGFDCKFCNKKHAPADHEGFPVNRPLLKLLTARAEHVFRNPRADELTARMVEVKAKCDNFQFNVENRVDQITEHCIFLRNHVNLETQMLVEKVYEFNESLISEIGVYEKGLIESFRSGLLNKKASEKLIEDVNKFYNKTVKYLNEFIIDNAIIEDSMTKAAKIIHELNDKDEAIENAKLHFIRNDDQLERNLLGSLAFKPVNKIQHQNELLKFKVVDLSNWINNYQSNLNLFRFESNGHYEAFYIDQNSMLNVSTFDSDGKILKTCNKIIEAKIKRVNFVKLNKVFVLNVSLAKIYEHFMIKGTKIKCYDHVYSRNNRHFMITLNENLDYSAHLALNNPVSLISSNKSKIMCVESNNGHSPPDCLLFHTVLSDLERKRLDGILARDEQVLDLKMNDTNIFFLCDTNKIKIVNISTFLLVRVIDSNGDQIQLLSTVFFVIFDSKSRVLHQYDQYGDFSKEGTFCLNQELEAGLQLCIDNSKRYSFYDSNVLKFINID